jgi:hypothetical protein
MITSQQLADNNSKKDFANMMLIRFKQMNIDAGINAVQANWLHHRARALETFIPNSPVMTVDVLNMALAGDIEAAYVALSYCQADDMTQAHHWLSQERVDFLKTEIAIFMGWV